MVRHDGDQIELLVAGWGQVNTAEVANAVSEANDAQRAFHFVPMPDVVTLDDQRYLLRNGALNLDQALRDVIADGQLPVARDGNLILVTSKPYSNQDDLDGTAEYWLDNGFYFLQDWAGPNNNVAIISTYIWQQLPSRPELPMLAPSGRRTLEPYLLQSFAVLAANRLVDIPNHRATRGCPFDYLHHVPDIDRFFEAGRICDSCDSRLQSGLRQGQLTSQQYLAIKRLVTASLGKESQYTYDVAVSFSGSERRLAKRIASSLIKAGLAVFYDELYESEFIGRELTAYFGEVYSTRSRLCLILLSKEYLIRNWPTLEAEFARSRRLADRDYVVVYQLEEAANLPGLPSTVAYFTAKKHRAVDVVRTLTARIARAE